jgi:hypothetical protein
MASYLAMIAKSDHHGAAPADANDLAHHEQYDREADSWRFRNPFPSFTQLVAGPPSLITPVKLIM